MTSKNIDFNAKDSHEWTQILISMLKTVKDGLIDFNAKDNQGWTQILILMLKTVMNGLKYWF